MIVNPKQQKIMKPIYNVWILLFCLTFTSCYEDDSIIPTPDPLAQAGGFEFPQGDNSWDNDAMKIYQDFGVKIIYKDITEKTSIKIGQVVVSVALQECSKIVSMRRWRHSILLL